MSIKHIFTVGVDKYILDENNQRVLQQPKTSDLTYAQARQLNIDSPPLNPSTAPNVSKTLKQFLRRLGQQNNVNIIDLDIKIP